MKKKFIFLSLLALQSSFITLTAQAVEAPNVTFIPAPFDKHWFVRAGCGYAVKSADSEMKIIQQKYPTLQCRHVLSLASSSALSLYSVYIPEDFPSSLLEQFKKENIIIEAPRKLKAL